ncbi:hypothetical protein NYY87_19835, partial [Acinetobacter baumannii]|nr:hypothetical protein [Acinetobacter baumannii]
MWRDGGSGSGRNDTPRRGLDGNAGAGLPRSPAFRLHPLLGRDEIEIVVVSVLVIDQVTDIDV